MHNIMVVWNPFVGQGKAPINIKLLAIPGPPTYVRTSLMHRHVTTRKYLRKLFNLEGRAACVFAAEVKEMDGSPFLLCVYTLLQVLKVSSLLCQKYCGVQ